MKLTVYDALVFLRNAWRHGLIKQYFEFRKVNNDAVYILVLVKDRSKYEGQTYLIPKARFLDLLDAELYLSDASELIETQEVAWELFKKLNIAFLNTSYFVDKISSDIEEIRDALGK